MFKKSFYTLLAGTILMSTAQVSAATTEDPMPEYPDGAAIVVSGTINEIREDEFDLNYGTGAITVELDGWGWTGEEARYLNSGDRITVSGRIDDDLFEGREIEADNIFLQDALTYYYTNDAYPSYYPTYDENSAVSDGTYVSMRGTVSDIAGREFTLRGTNNTTMRIDASDLDYDPFDDEGLQKIKAGDQIHVYGEIDKGLFESQEIMADSIVVLSQAGGGSSQNEQ